MRAKTRLVVGALMAMSLSLQGQALEQSFENPPTSARPFTWWHWMSGNVSKQGIEKDLAAMHQFGLGGFQNFNADLGVARGKGAVEYASPEWFELFGYSAKIADQYGLQMGAHNCAGWSSSGGPWITPEYASKMIVWSETVVEAGTTGKIKLNEFVMNPDAEALNYHKEIAVLAVPTLPSDAAFQKIAAEAQTKKHYKPHPAKFRRLKEWVKHRPKMR
ncbi:MAG: glycosyl hydrolase, partial [Coraliomargarita sp.]